MAILDADKEGFLRSETSLIQIIGRAARNVDGAGRDVCRQGHRFDAVGDQRDQPPACGCRRIYNEENGIDPQTIRKQISDILEIVQSAGTTVRIAAPGRPPTSRRSTWPVTT